jgi:hypothetical protein
MIISSFIRRCVAALLPETVLVLIIVLVCGPAAASPAPSPPDTETRSLIIGVDAGTAPAAKADRKAALSALLNRGRQAALEKARNRLLELGKFGLDFDLVRLRPAPAAGGNPLPQGRPAPSLA